MYQNVYCNRKTEEVFVWDDDVGLKQYPMSSFKYAYKKQAGGTIKSIYGDELTKVYNYNDNDSGLFESDVSMEMRVLLDLYPNSDEPSKGHRIGVIDIEVSTAGGFPSMEMADKEITGISLYDYITRTCYTFVLDKEKKIPNSEKEDDAWYPKNWKDPEGKEKIVVLSFDNEDDLLISFMDKWNECSFTIITGWNVDFFDLPYLYLRLKNCLGAKVAKCLSPIGAAYLNGFSKKLTIGGISVMDYILLYKKFSGRMEPTYALGPIGQKSVGIGKVQYRGNLDDLYKEDITKFLEYNITDVKIVVALDRKLKYIDLARSICHVGHVPYENFHMSSRYLDGATLMYLIRNGMLVATNKPARGREEYEERLEEGEEGFSGAFVKEPVPGRYEWIFDLDLTSMYPKIIISLNISPETKVGKVEGYSVEAHVTGKMKEYKLGNVTYTPEEFKSLIEKSDYSVSSNGVIYRQDKRGVIPTLLSLWFAQRAEMRVKAAQYKREGNMELYNFYNQRQQIWKILLNSFYGVLGLPIFRFYDVDNAEAVTTTGVDIIQTTAKAINTYYKHALEQDGDWVIYSDTDSCFVNAVPIIQKRYPDINLNDEDAMTKAIMEVTTEVQTYVNNFYDIIANRFFNLKTKRFQLKRNGVMVDTSHEFEAKQEVISKSSFWLAKKRYAQWIIHEEGALLKEPRMEVRGIDIVRTSFPLSFRKFMDLFFRKLLTSSSKEELDNIVMDFREKIKTLDVVEIAKNTSVKFVSGDGVHNYNPENRHPFQFVKGTPAQVKACLMYNDLLVKLGLEKQYESIHHGAKIKWVYVQKNEFGVEAIAFKGDGNDPDEILNIINKLVDRKKMFEQELKSKFSNDKGEGIYDVLKWRFPSESSKLAENFFDFNE